MKTKMDQARVIADLIKLVFEEDEPVRCAIDTTKMLFKVRELDSIRHYREKLREIDLSSDVDIRRDVIGLIMIYLPDMPTLLKFTKCSSIS